MDNKLLMCEHKEKGTWYFTNIGKAAQSFGLQYNHLNHYVNKGKDYQGWSLKWIDGPDVLYRYINPKSVY